MTIHGLVTISALFTNVALLLAVGTRHDATESLSLLSHAAFRALAPSLWHRWALELLLGILLTTLLLTLLGGAHNSAELIEKVVPDVVRVVCALVRRNHKKCAADATARS